MKKLSIPIIALVLVACGKSAYFHVDEGSATMPGGVTIHGKGITYARGQGALHLIVDGKEVSIDGAAAPVRPAEPTPEE